MHLSLSPKMHYLLGVKGRFHEQTEIYKINHRCIQIGRRLVQTYGHRPMHMGAILAAD